MAHRALHDWFGADLNVSKDPFKEPTGEIKRQQVFLWKRGVFSGAVQHNAHPDGFTAPEPAEHYGCIPENRKVAELLSPRPRTTAAAMFGLPMKKKKKRASKLHHGSDK